MKTPAAVLGHAKAFLGVLLITSAVAAMALLFFSYTPYPVTRVLNFTSPNSEYPLMYETEVVSAGDNITGTIKIPSITIGPYGLPYLDCYVMSPDQFKTWSTEPYTTGAPQSYFYDSRNNISLDFRNDTLTIYVSLIAPSTTRYDVFVYWPSGPHSTPTLDLYDQTSSTHWPTGYIYASGIVSAASAAAAAWFAATGFRKRIPASSGSKASSRSSKKVRINALVASPADAPALRVDTPFTSAECAAVAVA